jgi:hypothetical protein
LEALLSKLIAILEAAKMGEKVIIESMTCTTASVGAFAQAYTGTCEADGEKKNEMLVLQLEYTPYTGQSHRGGGRGGGCGGGRGGGRQDTSGEVSQEFEAFMETKPSQEKIIKLSLSDQCTRKHRHIVVNIDEPFDDTV